MNSELKAYLDKLRAETRALYAEFDRQFPLRAALPAKPSAGAPPPPLTRSAVVASDGDPLIDSPVVAVVPDGYCFTAKAQEILEVAPDAPPTCAEMAPITCSTKCSTQVDAVASADEVQDGATTVHPMPAANLNHKEVAQTIPQDLKEFREEFRGSIKEAVAEAFGNSKPALEHATTPAASQLLSTDAPASPTTIVDVVPVLAALDASAKTLDIDATGVVPPTPTTCSTECPSRALTATTSVFTLGTTPTSATATIDVTPVLAASVVTNDFTTPSRMLQAAAPALIHELRVLRPAPWPSFQCHSRAADTTKLLSWLWYMWRMGPVQKDSCPQSEIKALVSNMSMVCGNRSSSHGYISGNNLLSPSGIWCLRDLFLNPMSCWPDSQYVQQTNAVLEAPLCPERHNIRICRRGVAPSFLLADLLEKKLNGNPKYSLTITSSENGYKLLNKSLVIWRTSAVCFLFCCSAHFQWKVAWLFYHLSNCCPVTQLRLLASTNYFTLMYAVHKNQSYEYIQLSHSNHCQEGTNLKVDHIGCAITSNIFYAYPYGDEDHAREPLFNLKLGVWFACVLPMSTDVRVNTSGRSDEPIQPTSNDFSCMCFFSDAYIQVQTFCCYMYQPEVQFDILSKALTRCLIQGSVKAASALMTSFVPHNSCPTAPSGNINSCAEMPPWLPGWTSTSSYKTGQWTWLLHVPSCPPDSLNFTQRWLSPWQPLLPAPAPKPPWSPPGHELAEESYGGELPCCGCGSLAVCRDWLIRLCGLQESYLAVWGEGAALLTWKIIGRSAEHQAEATHSGVGSLYVASRQWIIPWLGDIIVFTATSSPLHENQIPYYCAKFVTTHLFGSDGTTCLNALLNILHGTDDQLATIMLDWIESQLAGYGNEIVVYGKEIVLCNIMPGTLDILVSQFCCEGVLPVYWGQGFLGALEKLEDLSCNLLLFSPSAIIILQGHWYLGLIHNIWIPPCLNWQRYLHAHWWVVQVQQATSHRTNKKSSIWYWYRQTSIEPKHQFIDDEVQRRGVQVTVLPICIAFFWASSKKCWTTPLGCFEPWGMDGVKLSVHHGHPPFQGGRRVTLLATLIDHNDYLNDDSSFNFIHVHLDHGYYHDGYHHGSSSTKERQVPWDPGGNSTAAAWGQAAFSRREGC